MNVEKALDEIRPFLQSDGGDITLVSIDNETSVKVRLEGACIGYALPQSGGQCSEIYPKKPIYDIPGFPEVLAGELVDNLMEQIKPFQPGFTLGERAETIQKLDDGTFIVTTNKGTKHHAPIVAIAGGLGSFEPRKPKLENLAKYEDKGIAYIIKDPEVYRDKKVDSVEKVQHLKDAGKIKLITPAEIIGLEGDDQLKAVLIKKTREEEPITLEVDSFIPLFGLSPKLGPIGDWGLEIEKNAIKVDNALDYQTNIPGVYAIGDVNTYPGKLKLILCGFHEATLMCQSAYQRIFPDKKYVMKYTTVGGVTGFDGSKKEAPKAVIKAIE
ncbi:Ferredoxin--NADP reductase 2 [Nymphon striatum]|nr:Ferredoxin--NADP reductase 2 [Nymphon striatum]